MSIVNRHLMVRASVIAAIMSGSPAWAEPLGQGGEAVEAAAKIEEITVTAQRRSQNLLSVPTSIQSVTAQQLQSTGIRQITDLMFTTPGYNVQSGSGYTQVFIRGIGNTIFVGADPSVATFIDDVPRIYGSMVDNFVDVDRVEVLKGAQGGLYGRNATGGVINIITRQPSTDEIKVDMGVSYGSRNTFRASGYINLPVSDKIAISLAAERRSHSAYLPNDAVAAPYTAEMFPSGGLGMTGEQLATALNSKVNTGGLNNEDFWAANSKILLKPSDNVKITVAGDYSKKDDRNGNGAYAVDPDYLRQNLIAGFAGLGISADLPVGFVPEAKKFRVNYGQPGFVRLKDYGVSATAVWSLPDVDLMSITAYRAQSTDFLSELTGAPVPYQSAHVENRKHFTYQEFRGISTSEGPLQLIGGATYLRTYFKGQVRFTGFGGAFPFFSDLLTANTVNRVTNYSVYGQTQYDFTDRLSLTGSARYIHEKNEAEFLLSGTPYSMKEKKLLPSATLSYKLNGGGNVYVRWARGYKSGGINPTTDIAIFNGQLDQGSVFKGETVDTFEAGYRAALFDQRVNFTSAIFYNDYRNLQIFAKPNAAHTNTILSAIINADSARTYGAEASLTWRVTKPVTLGVNAGYLNAKYKKFALTSSSLLVPFDQSGSQLNNAPEFQFSFTGNLDQPITDDLGLVGSALISHQSDVLYSPPGNPELQPPAIGESYWLVNARLGIRTADDKYEVAVFANNLTNSPYQTLGSSAAAGSTQLLWGNPRIVGAEIKVKF